MNDWFSLLNLSQPFKVRWIITLIPQKMLITLLIQPSSFWLDYRGYILLEF